MVADWLKHPDSPSELLINPRLPIDRMVEARKCIQKAPDALHFNHVFILSSGSESAPKLIALAKTAVFAAAEAVNTHLKSTTKDIWALTLPTFHVGGLGILARATLAGAQVEEFTAGWSAAGFHQFLTANQVTLSALVPTQLFDLCAANLSAPKTLRAVVIGGGALDAQLYSRARDLGWPVLPSYGMTECCSQAATASLDTIANHTLPSLELLGHLKARVNAAGCFELKGSSLLSAVAKIDDGVWIDPKVDGWFTTTDCGIVETPGSKTIIVPRGRQGRLVKVNGENVSLEDVEARLKNRILSRFPNHVNDLRVEARPDARSGQKLWLALEADADALEAPTCEQIAEIQNQVLAPFERSERLFFVKVFPRSELRKIIGADLSKWLTTLESTAKKI